MKIFAYNLRDFDEKPVFIETCEKIGVEYGYTSEYLSLENAHLAEGYITGTSHTGKTLLTQK